MPRDGPIVFGDLSMQSNQSAGRARDSPLLHVVLTLQLRNDGSQRVVAQHGASLAVICHRRSLVELAACRFVDDHMNRNTLEALAALRSPDGVDDHLLDLCP